MKKETQTLDRQATLKSFKNALSKIQFESEDDEGAAEYYSDLNHVVMAINEGRTDAEVLSIVERLSEESLLVFKAGAQ